MQAGQVLAMPGQLHAVALGFHLDPAPARTSLPTVGRMHRYPQVNVPAPAFGSSHGSAAGVKNGAGSFLAYDGGERTYKSIQSHPSMSHAS